ncbi:uncharacterized protein LOC122984115 [Thunnus albacares]|uniref:uncharacterized protein LOC122984115 n=1 Tax=Thunnus albacares TaxID=8236 RepID=UPI001CF6EAE8|nr:uncharacterized protein LOC122984115 [Thunnus albacares]
MVKGRMKQNKDEKKKKEDKTDYKGKKEIEKNEKREEITEVKRKENEVVKKETEEEKAGRPVLLKQSSNIQPEKNLQSQLKTFPDVKMNVEPQREEVASKYSSRSVVSFLPASCHEKGPKRELKDNVEFPVSNTQRIGLSSSVPKECTEPPVVSADIVISKQEPRITSHLPPIEPQNFTPHPLRPPPPAPEDPQPQPNRRPSGGLPVKDQRFLLSSAKYNTIRHQTQVPLDRKVLELYKKFKASNKNSSHHGKLSTSEKHRLAFRAMLSNTETQPPRFTHPECLSHPLDSDYSTQFAQTIHSINDQRGHKPMPEWRKSLYKLISLQGFRSPRATRLAATEHPLKSSNAKQPLAAVPTLQPGQAAVHQRVLQKIQMKDTQELASFCFHHVIPMPSQHSFFTLKPCGKTQYGKLQFDWMRGLGEEKLLKVSSVKPKDTAHKVVDEL